MTKSIHTPFSDGPHDTLIVCHNENHMKSVIDAFGYDAYYTTYGGSLSGRRFDKIIVFEPKLTDSKVQSEHELEYIRDFVPLKLKANGKIVYL